MKRIPLHITAGSLILIVLLSGCFSGFERAPAPRLATQEAKLVSEDLEADDGFGFVVALGSGIALAGAYHEDGAGVESGSVYPFWKNNRGQWEQGLKIVAPDGKPGDWFGFSLAIHGDTALVGATHESSRGAKAGAVYVMRLAGKDRWIREAKLFAPDARAKSQFGFTLALHGDTALIGAPFADGGAIESGRAYLFHRSAAGQWDAGQPIEPPRPRVQNRFGYSVALYGGTALIGAYLDDDLGKDAGAAYIFEQVGQKGWRLAGKLHAPDGTPEDWFGHSVALHGGIALIGASFEETGRAGLRSDYLYERTGVTIAGGGAAYIFQRGADGQWTSSAKLSASDAESADLFGAAVAVNGNLAVVAASKEDPGWWKRIDGGSVYVFRRIGPSSWEQSAKLAAQDNGRGDWFGWTLSLHENELLIGAPFEDSGGRGSGAAYIFR